MLMLVGLGNPGANHATNRHNIGFMAVDAIVRRHRFSPWRARFQGAVAEGDLAGEKVLALKPATFMNLSGQSVGEAARFYKLAPGAVIVLYDELELAPGRLKVNKAAAAPGTTASGASMLTSVLSIGVYGWASAIPATKPCA